MAQSGNFYINDEPSEVIVHASTTIGLGTDGKGRRPQEGMRRERT